MLFSGIFCILLGCLNLAIAQNGFNYFAAGWCMGMGVANIIFYFVSRW